MNLISSLHILLALRMSGDVPHFPQYAYMTKDITDVFITEMVVNCLKPKSQVILHKIRCVSIPKMVVWERVCVYCECYKKRVNAMCE